MSNFGEVLSAAQQLTDEDRLRLIDALWPTIPDETELEFSDNWKAEIERRVAELDAGTVTMVPWSQIYSEALARLGHGRKS